MELHKSVPNLHQVRDVIVQFEYEGVVRVCRLCCRTEHHAAKCTVPQCVRCGVFNHDQCALKCKHCGGNHGPSECKARTNSSAAPLVASSSSQEQVSGIAEDREAAPGDAEGSTQPQPEPISERAPGSEEQEAGLELAEAPPPFLLPPNRRQPRLPVRPPPALLTGMLPRTRKNPSAGPTLFRSRSGAPADHQGPPRRGWQRLRVAAPAALRKTTRFRSDPQRRSLTRNLPRRLSRAVPRDSLPEGDSRS
ncbi:hypothetical protein MRX96_035320 [Rhipicephalus microplus]